MGWSSALCRLARSAVPLAIGHRRMRLVELGAVQVQAARRLTGADLGQHRPQLRIRPLGALGHRRQPALLTGEQVEDQAGLAPVPLVQDKCSLRRSAG